MQSKTVAIGTFWVGIPHLLGVHKLPGIYVSNTRSLYGWNITDHM